MLARVVHCTHSRNKRKKERKKELQYWLGCQYRVNLIPIAILLQCNAIFDTPEHNLNSFQAGKIYSFDDAGNHVKSKRPRSVLNADHAVSKCCSCIERELERVFRNVQCAYRNGRGAERIRGQPFVWDAEIQLEPNVS